MTAKSGRCAATRRRSAALRAEPASAVSSRPAAATNARQVAPHGKSIKSAALAALRTNPDGLSLSQIAPMVALHYGRPVNPLSISPQLSRLRQLGIIAFQNGVWTSPPASELRVRQAMAALDKVMDAPINEDWEAHLRRCVVTVFAAASGIEAATADETALAGSAEGESPAPEGGDAQPPVPKDHPHV